MSELNKSANFGLLQFFTDSKLNTIKMSKFTSLIVGFICALLVVSVYADEEYSILTEDGAYNPGK